MRNFIPEEPVSIVLQAGGMSTRMGRDKGLVEFKNIPLILFVYQQVADMSDDVLVISNNPLPYRDLGFTTYEDVLPGMGALGGLYSGLFYANHRQVLMLACDMPYICKPLIRYMVGLAENYDVVVPRLKREEFAEPFRAIYNVACAPFIRSALENNQRRMISFYPQVRVRYVDWPEIEQFDPQAVSFFNINTPEDLEVALQLTPPLDID